MEKRLGIFLETIPLGYVARTHLVEALVEVGGGGGVCIVYGTLGVSRSGSTGVSSVSCQDL